MIREWQTTKEQTDSSCFLDGCINLSNFVTPIFMEHFCQIVRDAVMMHALPEFLQNKLPIRLIAP